MNVYLDLPLPIGCRIDFGFKPKSVSRMDQKLQEKKAIQEVLRAVNQYEYSKLD
jgi:hypothetical protein